MHARDSSHENAFALGQRSFNTIEKDTKFVKRHVAVLPKNNSGD